MASPSFGAKTATYTYTLPYTILIIKHVVKNTVNALHKGGWTRLFGAFKEREWGGEVGLTTWIDSTQLFSRAK
jgi:hypothetical protein